mmetsp:Transcript_15969/g.18656  ORF Transcript_15969/g.18656 Transcript_15969/m.18656 type:complete len:94 (+) Transcript_15969:847-1128(+)
MLNKMQKELTETKDALAELRKETKLALSNDTDESPKKKQKLVYDSLSDPKQLDEAISFDNLGGMFSSESFFSEGFDAMLPFADSSLEEKSKRA